MNINLKLLHTFLIAAEKESFKRAADETNRSPSAITMQMRDLEAQIGLQLFLRSPGRVTLTREGKMLLEQVQSGLMQIQDGLDQLQMAVSEKKNSLTMGCAPTLASTRLPEILSSFKVNHPNVQVFVHEVSTLRAIELLIAEEMEFFLGPEIADMREFQFDPIAADPLYAAIPDKFDRGAASWSLSDLASMPLILLSHPTALRSMLDALAQGQGLNLNVQYEVQQVTTALALARAGLGIALIPRIATLYPGTGLRMATVDDELATRKLGIAMLKGKTPSRHCQRLIDLIRSNLAGMYPQPG